MLEKDIEKSVRLKIEQLGGELKKWVCPGETGVPDRICILPGDVVIFIEFKKPGGKLAERQKYWRDKLIGMGCQYRLIESVGKAKLFLEEVEHLCYLTHTRTKKE